VHLANLTPIFVDCNDYLLMDSRMLRAAIRWCGSHLRAIMAVHIYGRQQCMSDIATILQQELGDKWPDNVKILEDLAEAHGLRPHAITDAACWSFYKNKVVAGEEGGAVAFKDSQYANNARSLRCLGFTAAHDFMHLPRGHNYRLANCLATKIMISLEDYESNLHERRRLESLYDVHCPPTWCMPPRAVPWVYDLRIRDLTSSYKLIKLLNEHDVQARHSFKPMSMQQEFDRCRTFTRGQARQASREIIYLPLQPGITPHCEEVFRFIKQFAPVVPAPASDVHSTP
jgi:perosamine synthetase